MASAARQTEAAAPCNGARCTPALFFGVCDLCRAAGYDADRNVPPHWADREPGNPFPASALNPAPLDLHCPHMAARFAAEPGLIDRGHARRALALINQAACLSPAGAAAMLDGAARAFLKATGPGGGIGQILLRRAAGRAVLLTETGAQLAREAEAIRANEAEWRRAHPQYYGVREGYVATRWPA